MTTKLTPQELERQTFGRLDVLRQELSTTVPPERVNTVGRRHFERLSRRATVSDFIPLLVYRFTREELVYGDSDRLHDAA